MFFSILKPSNVLEIVARLTAVSLGAGFFILIGFAIYNLFFHPLKSFPGPKLAAISPFVQLYHGLKGDRHLWTHKLHNEYGIHVRLAPNFVSMNTVDALHGIYGHGKHTKKAFFYRSFAAVKELSNTHNAINKTIHGRKKRVLSQAFSDSAMKGMEPIVLEKIRQFCTAIYRASQNNTDLQHQIVLSDWFSYLTFDVMGELCFGKGFGMISEGSQRGIIKLIDRAAFRHYVCGLWTPMDTWHLDRIFIRKLTTDRWNFISASRSQATQRAKERQSMAPDARKDFFHYLLKAKDPETGLSLDIKELWQESNVLMVAGSDTTSTELSAVMFYLLKTPLCMNVLKEKMRDTFSNVEEIVSGHQLNNMVYLKACIDEAMRLAPAVPGAMPREIMDGGTVVDGIFLPAGVECGTPCYSIHRNAAYYPQPDAFIPERWVEGAQWPENKMTTTAEMLNLARSAHCPFSIGPRGCIGKGIALMELKLTIARMLFLYDFEVAGKTGEDEEGHFAMVDHFTSQKEGPIVTVIKRTL